jgi:AcrR family transcriptional regulator
MRRIFDSAIRLFADQGYDATTQQEIAARAGVTVGSIYRRFPDKTAILYTLLEGFSKSRTLELNRMCEKSRWENKTFEEIILFYVEMIFSAYDLDVDMQRIMERRRLVDPVVGKLHSDLTKYAVTAFTRLLTPHCDVSARKVQLRFRILHSIVQGFLVYRILADPNLPDYGIALSAPELKDCVRELSLNMMNSLKRTTQRR